MDKTEQLLQQFVNEGISEIRQLKKQNDEIHKDMTELKVGMNGIQQQLNAFSESFRKDQERLERENEDLKKRLDNVNSAIVNLRSEHQDRFAEIRETHTKEVLGLQGQIKALETLDESQDILRLTKEIKVIEERTTKIESQQAKWLGALTVIGGVVGFIVAVAKGWLTALV